MGVYIKVPQPFPVLSSDVRGWRAVWVMAVRLRLQDVGIWVKGLALESCGVGSGFRGLKVWGFRVQGFGDVGCKVALPA